MCIANVRFGDESAFEFQAVVLESLLFVNFALSLVWGEAPPKYAYSWNRFRSWVSTDEDIIIQ